MKGARHTKQHFESIARALNGTKPRGEYNTVQHAAQWAHDVCAIADVCAASNAQFKRDRFYAACGYTATYGRS